MDKVPELRLRTLGSGDINADGDYVIYWMTSYRRPCWNFSLQRAVEWARSLHKPLVILEALRCGYRWASDRMHHFVIQGMADNASALARKRVLYYPYVEPARNAGKGLLAALGQRACVVVSDDFPCFFHPHMYQAAVRQIPVRLELVDANGILPLSTAPRVLSRAYDFRRFAQKTLPSHFDEMPEPDPLSGLRIPKIDRLPSAIQQRWPAADVVAVARNPAALSKFPIDHDVSVAPIPGGWKAAEKTLRTFLDKKLKRYAERRNQPQEDVASGLSPYLHFGHISVHQIFAETMARDGWTPSRIAEKATGSAQGWWGASGPVESFVDELITWREVGYNMCHRRSDYDQYDSLPDWAKQTLRDHERDPRPYTYSREEFAAAQTHDPLWNAAQQQLLQEGRVHNYLRMLWGKKVLEWSRRPQDALEVLIDLNNRYALDGRNPNSYSGVFWCLGRYDRPWGPERPVFGKVRFMSSENTARKVRVKDYIRRYTV